MVLCAVAGVWVGGILTDDSLVVGRLLFISIAYGTAYGSALYAFSSDGAVGVRVMNPYVCLCLWMVGKLRLTRAAVFILLQCVSSLLAVLTLLSLLPHGLFLRLSTPLRPFELIEEVTPGQSVLMSFVATFFYLLVVIITCFGSGRERIVTEPGIWPDTSEQQPQTVHELNCLICSFAVFAGTISSSSISAGFLNPLVALPVAALSGVLSWMPFLGSILACFCVVPVALFCPGSFEVRPSWRRVKELSQRPSD